MLGSSITGGIMGYYYGWKVGQAAGAKGFWEQLAYIQGGNIIGSVIGFASGSIFQGVDQGVTGWMAEQVIFKGMSAAVTGTISGAVAGAASGSITGGATAWAYGGYEQGRFFAGTEEQIGRGFTGGAIWGAIGGGYGGYLKGSAINNSINLTDKASGEIGSAIDRLHPTLKGIPEQAESIGKLKSFITSFLPDVQVNLSSGVTSSLAQVAGIHSTELITAVALERPDLLYMITQPSIDLPRVFGLRTTFNIQYDVIGWGLEIGDWSNSYKRKKSDDTWNWEFNVGD